MFSIEQREGFVNPRLLQSHFSLEGEQGMGYDVWT
jgi:hypothetical protein